MIGFELPLALASAAFVLLPILIHTLARRAPLELPLPTMRFLASAPRARRSFTFPQDRLVLLCRGLAIAAIALAAARPFLAGAGTERAPSLTVLVLDDSLSMAHGDRFARARAGLARALERLPEDAPCALVLTSRPRGTVETAGLVRRRLDAAEPTAVVPTFMTTSLAPALEAARELASGRDRVRVVLASDLDRPALEGVERHAVPGLELVDVGQDEPGNAWLTEVALSPPRPVAGDAVSVEARLETVGLDEATVALELDGKTVAERRVLRGELVRFDLPRALGNRVTGALVVHARGDRLSLDDRAAFATKVLHQLSVVVVGRETARRGSAAREQPVLDAIAALARAQGITLELLSRSDEALVADDLVRATVLVLVAPGELSPLARAGIAAFVARGGGLLVLLDEHAPEATLEALARAGILPVSGRGVEADPPAPPHAELGAFDPTLARAVASLALAPQAALEPVGAPPSILLTGSRGEPLWVERGRVAVLAFAPLGRNAGLAREAAFPLLVRRALQCALGADRATRPIAGSALDLAALARESGEPETALAAATLVGPAGTERPLASTAPVLLEGAGAYEVRNVLGTTLAAFAVSPATRESALERASEAARAALTGEARPASSVAGARDLTAALAAAALVFLLLGSLLSNRALDPESELART
jgi:hypothetical protein